jgi:hypothetical protein
MSHLFQRRGNAARSEFDEARVVLYRLKACDAETRLAAGAGVHLADADFIRRFAGLESFRRIPAGERKRFCSELSDLEFRLRSQKLVQTTFPTRDHLERLTLNC